MTGGVREEFTAAHDKGVLSLGAGAMINSPHFGEALSALANAANLAVYTTDPRLLIALTTVIVAVVTIVLVSRAMRYAACDDALFSDFSREHQREREARFLAQFTGRHEHMANAPHVAGSPGSLHIAGVGAAHDDRSGDLPPADRSSRSPGTFLGGSFFGSFFS